MKIFGKTLHRIEATKDIVLSENNIIKNCANVKGTRHIFDCAELHKKDCVF